MNKLFLFGINFLIKGWEVSILILLPFLQKDFHLSLFQIGILSMTFALLQVGFTLSAGYLSQKFGNKNLIATTALSYSLAWLSLIFAHSFVPLILTHALAGVGSGLFEPLGHSLIASHTSKDELGKMLGNYAGAGDVGRIVLSTCTTALIAIFSWKVFPFLYGIIALVFFAGYLITQRTEISVIVSHDEISSASLKDFLKNKFFVFAIMTGFFDSFASSSLYIFIPLLLVPKGISLSYAGIFTTIFFIGYLSGRLVLGRLADIYGYANLLIVSEICMIALLFCLIISSNFWIVGILLLTLGMFTRGTAPIIRAMAVESMSDQENFDKGFSILDFSLRSSSVASRPLFGFIGGLSGITSIFYLASFFAFFALIPTYFLKKNRHLKLAYE